MHRLLIVLAIALATIAPVVTSETRAPDPQASRWRFVAGGATAGNGAFSPGGTFYFAAEDRYLYAVDRNGTMIWRTDLGRRPGGSVAVGSDGAILATLDRETMVALNPDGRLIWRAHITEGRPFAPVLLANGVIVTVRRPATLEARSHAGRLLWTTELSAPVSAAPVGAGEGTLIVATTDGELVLVSVDGRIERRRYVGEVASQIVATGEGIALGSTNGRVVAVDADLDPRWRADVGSAVRDVRVSASGDLYATSDDGALTRV
ncbi:MAG: PQQ-binding-like beta-propeller repeat protein, partial [Spirochaetota bacterium]